VIKGLIVSNKYGFKKILGKSLLDIMIEKNKTISQFFVLIDKLSLVEHKSAIKSNVVYIFNDDKGELGRYINVNDKILIFHDDYFVDEPISIDEYKDINAKYIVVEGEGITIQSLLDFYKLRESLIVERNRGLINAGVDIIDINSTYIDYDCNIGKETVIFPNSMVSSSNIGEKCIISGRIKNSTIGDEVVIDNSVIEDSTIESDVQVGPYSYIHNECRLRDGCIIGSYVEIKKSEIGCNSKIKHQSVILDTTIDDKVNIGAGVITANYDGEMKSVTRIGNNSFIGCNSVLIAPINIGANSFIAADTTVVKNVEDNEFSISRVHQVNKQRRKINI